MFKTSFQVPSNGNYTPKVNFDGANGVGAEKMASLAKNLDDFLQVRSNLTPISLTV